MHKLNLLGLRFFTVYGPRGRTDMAAYMWARAIEAGEPIKVFQTPSGVEMARDFTYVGDIVSGIRSVLPRRDVTGVLNIGKGSPDKVSDLIGELEACFNKQAVLVKVPQPPGDVPITYADTARMSSLVGYAPQVSLKEGIRRFCEWFKSDEARAVRSKAAVAIG